MYEEQFKIKRRNQFNPRLHMYISIRRVTKYCDTEFLFLSKQSRLDDNLYTNKSRCLSVCWQSTEEFFESGVIKFGIDIL